MISATGGPVSIIPRDVIAPYEAEPNSGNFSVETRSFDDTYSQSKRVPRRTNSRKEKTAAQVEEHAKKKERVAKAQEAFVLLDADQSGYLDSKLCKSSPLFDCATLLRRCNSTPTEQRASPHRAHIPFSWCNLTTNIFAALRGRAEGSAAAHRGAGRKHRLNGRSCPSRQPSCHLSPRRVH